MATTCERAAPQPAAEDRPATPSPAVIVAGQSDDGTNNRRHPDVPVDAGILARVLALSDERDLQLNLRLADWRRGWAAAVAHLGDVYEAGWVDGILARKGIGHAIVEAARLDAARWGGPRERFGEARPGDYPGRPDEAS